MLTRNVPLRRTPINRGTSVLKRARMKVYRPTTTSPATRDRLVERAEGKCEGGLFACTSVGTDVHHRITKKAGGRKGTAAARHDRLSNTVWLCRRCHSWVTDNPAEAYQMGLCLRENNVTELEPMAYRDECWVLLGDDGSVVGFP